MSFDSLCFDLAEHFLIGSGVDTSERRDALAQVIQDAIEEQINEWEREDGIHEGD